MSLYPDGHPAIVASLTRLVDVGQRALADGPLTVTVRPGGLLIDSRAPARPDAADRRARRPAARAPRRRAADQSAADAEAWQHLPAAAGRPTGRSAGPRRHRARSGRHPAASTCTIREVDYAEVLREREAGIDAGWDAIIDHCLQGDAVDLDEETWKVLLEIAGDAERLGGSDRADRRARRRRRRPPPDRCAAAPAQRVIAGAVRHSPERVDEFLANMSGAAEPPVARRDARADDSIATKPPRGINVVDAMVTRMTDASLSRLRRTIGRSSSAAPRLAWPRPFRPSCPSRSGGSGSLRWRVRKSRPARSDREATLPGAVATRHRHADLVPRRAVRLDGLCRASCRPRVAMRPTSSASATTRPTACRRGWRRSAMRPSAASTCSCCSTCCASNKKDPATRSCVEPVAAHVDDLVLLGDFEAAAPLVRALSAETARNGRATHRPAASAALDRLCAGISCRTWSGTCGRSMTTASTYARRSGHGAGPGDDSSAGRGAGQPKSAGAPSAGSPTSS